MACSKVISDFEILSADETGRRRDRSEAERIRIVEESFRGQRQGSATARRYGLSRSLLTRWRKEYREGLTSSRTAPTGPEPRGARVQLLHVSDLGARASQAPRKVIVRSDIRAAAPRTTARAGSVARRCSKVNRPRLDLKLVGDIH